MWSCAPQMHSNLPCFKDPEFTMDLNNSSRLLIQSSTLIPNVGAVVINVTIKSHKSLTASQVLEIKQIPNMLQ